MSFAVVYSRAQLGMASPRVTIEVHLASGLPAFNIVGLPEKVVKGIRERVRSALLTNGFSMPVQRITVNLAPADLHKEGGRFDLPVALGLLVANGVLSQSSLEGYEVIGELGLQGSLRECKGILPVALSCFKVNNKLLAPRSNEHELAMVKGLSAIAADHLVTVVSHFLGINTIHPIKFHVNKSKKMPFLDMQDVRGQHAVKRALEVAASGSHSVLMQGPPGSGKTMIARRFPGLLPQLNSVEAIEIAAIHSLTSRGFDVRNWMVRPFRTPHHSASAVALIGGGSVPQPGEISLAHHGVLFLDELLEFSRHVLESLREPMEYGEIHISRAAHQVCYPAQFQLIAAMNPCPCGYHTDPGRECSCSGDQIVRYQRKLSGPVLDRMDIQVDVPRQKIITLSTDEKEEPSSVIALRVVNARLLQIHRQGKLNAYLSQSDLKVCKWIGANEKRFLIAAVEQLKLSARAYFRTIKVARTIADMECSERVLNEHISEALNWRMC